MLITATTSVSSVVGSLPGAIRCRFLGFRNMKFVGYKVTHNHLTDNGI